MHVLRVRHVLHITYIFLVGFLTTWLLLKSFGTKLTSKDDDHFGVGSAAPAPIKASFGGMTERVDSNNLKKVENEEHDVDEMSTSTRNLLKTPTTEASQTALDGLLKLNLTLTPGLPSSDSSLLEMDCRFPIVEPNEPNLHDYVHKYRNVLCVKRMPNMATLSFGADHTLIVHNELEPYQQVKVPTFRCTYQGIDGGFAPNITVIDYVGEEVELNEDVETPIPFDQFVVRCRNRTLVSIVNGEQRYNDTVFYERAFAGFANATERIKGRRQSSPDSPSLAILVLDSVARNQFLRHMPRSVKFMRKLGFHWLNAYTKVGDNSAVNLLPILAGKSILPSVGGDGSEVVAANGTRVDLDETEFLWDIMQRKNCLTMFNDDILDINRGLFHYPTEIFEGFRGPPTDFYFRAYHLFNPRYMFHPILGGQCMKTGQMTSDEYLDIWEKFSTTFRDVCHFSFNFLTELTHDAASNLGAMDDRLRTSLERMFANDVLNTTALLIMGDHGNRIGRIQHSYVGRVEERTPFAALYLPPAVRQRRPIWAENFRHNINRLTSNFDLHQTLKDLTRLGDVDDGQKSRKRGERGRSLFTTRLPATRTCTEVGVPENFCVCMERRNLSRMIRDSKEYVAIERLVSEFLDRFECVQGSSNRSLVEDRLQPLAINQMVRHGLRDAAKYTRELRLTQAALELQYYDVHTPVGHTTVPTLNTTGAVVGRFRVKQYVNEFTFSIVDEPILLLEDSRSGSWTSFDYFTNVCKYEFSLFEK